jgi:HEAT repeat protein
MKTIIVVIILGFLSSGIPRSLPAEEAAAGEKPPEAAELIRDLGSSEPAERSRARALLAGMGEEAGPPLLAALASGDREAAGGLLEVLAFIRYRPAAPAAEKIWQETDSVPLKLQAAQALCRLDHNYNRFQGYILSRVREGKEEDRMLAMQMLGYIGDRRVVEPLVQIFNDPKLSDQIRQAAIWDLAHTPVRESAEALVEMVNSPEIEWFYKEIVIAALRRLAGQGDMAPIVSELLERSQGLPER